jgi:hypothetical protein
MPITPTQAIYGRTQHISLPSPSASLSTSSSDESLEIHTPEPEAPFPLFTKITPAFAEPAISESAPWSDPENSLDLAMGKIHIEHKPAVPMRSSRRRQIPVHVLSG